MGAAFLLLVAAWGARAVALPPQPGARWQRRVVVTPGMSARAVARLLRRQGVIAHPWLFTLLLRLRHQSGALQAGTYLLGPGMSMTQVLTALVSGQVASVRVTVPEGWTVAQLVQALSHAGFGSPPALWAAVRDPGLRALAGLPPPAPGVRDPLEGYLFPATYPLPLGASPRSVFALMLRRFRRAWSPRLAAAARTEGLSLVQVVTLASIVQREVAAPTQMAVVAGVYLNRLRRGMDLDADPTVLYALGLLGGPRPVALTARALQDPSPYNTFQHPGLPPGPICNPGLAALQAVLHPAPVHALYFLTAPDGRLVLAQTLAQQIAHQRQLLGGA